MRPEILFPLFAPVTALPGVGPKVAEALGRLTGAKVIDLLWHLPSGVIDRRVTRNIAAARAGRVATLLVRVGRHQPPLTPRQPYRVFCGDDSGSLVLVFFHARGDYLSRVLPVGSERIVSGTVDLFADSLQMTHPDYILGVGERDLLPAFEPVYPLTAGLNPRTLVKLVSAAVARAPELAEWHDPALQRQRGWPAWRQAVEQAHHPEDAAAVLAEAPARMRLAYDEMLANQLALALIRAHGRRGHGRAIAAEGKLAGKALAALGFRLTGSQQRAIAEIAADMAAPRRMLRLLQGDVGSGKTVVALVAMLNAAECGFQAAMMAPTEVLARQHYATIAPIAEAAGVPVALLTGRDKGPGARRDPRQARLGRAASGRRHPRAVPGRRRLQGSGLRRHRRAAPVRGAPAAGPHRQGTGRRRPGDDRDADPADADADRLWRHGRLEPHREAAGPPPGGHQGGAFGTPRARSSPRFAVGLPKAPRRSGSARWWRTPRKATWRRPRPASPSCAPSSARPLGSCTGG